MKAPFAVAVCCVALSSSGSRDAAADAPRESPIALSAFKIIERQSGPDNYYSVTSAPDAHIHADYRPPFKTAVLGFQIPDAQRRSVAGLRWSWRAVVLPKGGNECAGGGKGDSAAVVYVTWKRGLRWYTLKYVWSAGAPKGRVCDSKRNPFVAQDTIIVDSGEPVGEWRTVRVVPDDEFRNHFEGGDPHASVPDLVGVGIMSDGDQTKSQSAADYKDFVLVLR
jgi:hypothetical protein